LSEKLKTPIEDIKNVIIWGNHSLTQYPDVNHGQVTIGGQKKSIR
jgi:malate dehydrogenase